VLDGIHNTVVSHHGLSDRPTYLSPFADRLLPLCADLRQIVRPKNGCASLVLAMYHYNPMVGKTSFEISFHEERIVPISDLTEEDPSQSLGAEIQAVLHVGKVVYRDIGNHERRKK